MIRLVTSSDIRIRISQSQKEQLKNLAEASGYKTISQYVRSKVFDSDLGVHTKLNEIIKILEVTKNEKEKNRKSGR